MEAIGAFQALLAVAISVAGWFLRSLHDDHRKLADEMTANTKALSEKIANQQMTASDRFVRRDDYHNDLREIKSMLDKIFNQLNEKADKA